MEVNLLLDTNAYSALKSGVKSAAHRIGIAELLYIPAIVVGELLFGFQRGNRFEENRRELNAFLADPLVRFVGIDFEVCQTYARIGAQLREQGTPIPSNDQWIAATAIRHRLTLLTRDGHFAQIQELIVECWD